MKLLLPLLLITVTAFSQPTLSGFTVTQQNQLRAYMQWQGKQSADSVKKVITNDYKLAIQAVTGTIFAVRKSLADTLNNLQYHLGRSDSLARVTTGLNTAVWNNMNGFKRIQDSANAQDATNFGVIVKEINNIKATYFTKEEAAAINAALQVFKEWMDRVRK